MKKRVFAMITTVTLYVIGSFVLDQQRGWCEEFVVKYHALAETDTRVYELGLLQAVLEKTVDQYGPYTIEASKTMYNPQRAEIELKEGKEVNVDWFAATQVTMKEAFIPIAFPLMKGVLGYRIFLIHKKDKEKFAKIKTLDELKQLSVGQGLGWGDVPIFRHNGFTVVTGKDYDSLFEMLVVGRFDFFSRGIGEALPEYNLRKDRLPDLWIEETILLYYPYPIYYFVNRQHPKLAERIKRGLYRMLEDGSFEKFFWEYHRKIIDQARVKERKLFTIENPLLTPDIPLDHKELWFDPATYDSQ
jgi:hypothetical protein